MLQSQARTYLGCPAARIAARLVQPSLHALNPGTESPYDLQGRLEGGSNECGSVESPEQESSIVMFPSDVLAKILHLVPQRQRLVQCALVCRTWRAAAVEASTSIDARAAETTQLKFLRMWLECYGSKLSNVSITGPEHRSISSIFRVPCLQLQQLQSLHLRRLIIGVGCSDLTDSSSSSRSDDISTNNSSLYSGTWANLTALTSLHIADTCLDTRDVSEFGSIRSLRRLVLSTITVYNCSDGTVTFPTQITCLILDSVLFGDESFYGTSNLELKSIGLPSQLEHLKLAVRAFDDLSTLSDLPLRLTHLELHTSCSHRLSAARLGQLTALVHLDVAGPRSMDPQLLSDLVQLRHLGLNRLSFHRPQDNVAAVETLLATLPGLSQLEYLSLAECKMTAVRSVQQYSALVSSSVLTCLDLRECYLRDNAVLNIFTAGRQCPALQVLPLACQYVSDEGPYNIRHGALNALVNACPALQELQLLPGSVDPSCWVQLSALQTLTGFSKLAFTGNIVHDDSMALLSSFKLPSLRELTIRVPYRGGDQQTFTARGVLSLRGLTQLTRLELWHHELGCESDVDEDQLEDPDDFRAPQVMLSNENGLTCLEELLKSKFKSNLHVLRFLLKEKSEEVNAAIARAEAAESKVYQLEQRVAELEQQAQEQHAVANRYCHRLQ